MAGMGFDPDTKIGGASGRFPSTQHSAVEAARWGEGPDRQRALDTIIAAYWKPVYKYVRIRWRQTNEEAKDTTQAFFARALEKDYVGSFDTGKGTFRTFLRTCVDGFVAKEIEAANRLKRGGGTMLESLDGALEPVDADDPESCFHREWVRSLFELAVQRLCEQCAAQGKQIHFELFERYDLDDEPVSYEELAKAHQLPVSSVTNHLAFARREFRRHVLALLRELTATDREFRTEARVVLGKRRA
jgi:RNA polymerase sigma factor (sigma-70 family)